MVTRKIPDRMTQSQSKKLIHNFKMEIMEELNQKQKEIDALIHKTENKIRAIEVNQKMSIFSFDTNKTTTASKRCT